MIGISPCRRIILSGKLFCRIKKMDIILAIVIFLVLFRVIMTKDDGLYRRILLIGFGLRLILLLITSTDLLEIPDAHIDADNFHDIALNHPGLFSDSDYHLTNYTRLLSVLYVITNDSRWFAQYVNLLLSVLTLVYLRRILCVLVIQETIAKRLLMVAALMPFLNIYSVVLMREAWVTFFVVLSLYYFICWYLKIGNGGFQIAKSILTIILAMWMHAGVIGIIFGYFVAFLTYYRDGDKIRISTSTYVALFFMSIFALILLLNISALFSKFDVADFGEYAAAKSSGEGGGSDYLTWLDLSSPQKILMYTPLKMFYFLYSPIIIDWRGLNDVAAFVLDSSIYFILSWFILRRKVVNPQYRFLKRFLLISVLITVVMFSFGTSNTGTAIRHRAKICSFMLVLTSISTEKKRLLKKIM